MRANDSAKLAEIHEMGFDILNQPRKGKGGGVGFIFNAKVVKLVRNNVAKYSSFEALEAVLTTSTDTLRLCVVYRSTQHKSRKKYLETRQAKFFEDFSDYLDCLSSKSGKPMICGDFNFHLENQTDSIACQFLNLIQEKGFTQHITSSTHVSGGILDLVLTQDTCNDRIDVRDIFVTENTGTTSDHFLVGFNVPLCPLPIPTKNWVTKEIRELSKIDLDSFKKDLSSEIPNANSIKSLGEAVDIYNSVLNNVLEKHAPLKPIHVCQNDSPWFNKTCKDARTERRKAQRLHKKDTGNQELLLDYKEKQIDASIIIDRARNNFYNEKLSAACGDPKTTYQIINTLFDKEYSQKKLPKGLSDMETATSMKNFFTNKVTEIYKDIETSQVNDKLKSNMGSNEACSATENNSSASYFKLLVPSQIQDVILAMGTKSCSLDPIPTWIFKNCLNELLPLVTLIINVSLQSGCFPEQLKAAVIHPHLKKPGLDSDMLNSYRPVSNLSFLSKIIEKCVHIQLTEYITKNRLFPELQSGYRKDHSCETAVIKIHNDVLIAMDKQSHVCLMLIDLSAAFDTVNHEYLLKRLQNVYQLKGIIIEWIRSYLSGRSFKVSVNGSYSDEATLEIGVPQGSILGPLLFILYTKGLQSLAQRYNFSIHLYADDTQIYFELNPITGCTRNFHDLEKCFKDIKEWMTVNYLKMNDDKTNMMEFHSPYTPFPPQQNFCLNSFLITPVSETKNLGYWFDEHLALNTQIKKISQTCYENLRKLGRIGSKLSKELKIQLVHSCIHSFIDNYNSTFFSLSHIQLKKLQKIQNAAVKYIFNLKGKDRFQSMKPFLKDLHFLPVVQRIRFKIAMLTFKCINNIAPSYLSCLLSLRQINSHSSRADNDFYILKQPPHPRCIKTTGAFSHSAPKIWNDLPYAIRSLTNIEVFKKSLKTHLFKFAFDEPENQDFDFSSEFN